MWALLGIKREGLIFFTLMLYVAFSVVTLEPLGLILCPERQSMQNALGGC